MKTNSGGQKKGAKSIVGQNRFRKVVLENFSFSACTLLYIVVTMFTFFQGESGRSSRKKSSHHGHRRHRPSVENDGLLPLTEESFKSLTTNEMERGLLETLMATSDSSTLKRFVQQYETQSCFVNSRS